MTSGSFRPSWWLRNRHLQTIWQSVFSSRVKLETHRERLELPDGDFVDLDWTGEEGPIAIVLHGLEGSIRSPYVRSTLKALNLHGWQGVLMHFRGCSGETNRLMRGYHSGETGDLDYLISEIRRRYPDTPIALIGFSLGGSVMLRWLSEQGDQANVVGAVAVSVPFVLNNSVERMDKGLSRFYQRYLLSSLHRSVRAKLACMPMDELNVNEDRLQKLTTFKLFDDAITAPLHGFRDAAHYYAETSVRSRLKSITVSTLIIHSQDDPFMSKSAIPTADELSPSTQLELTKRGGHVGFISGPIPFLGRSWLARRIPAYLEEQLRAASDK